MKRFLLLLGVLSQKILFAISTNTIAASVLLGATTVFPIDPTQRGKDISQLFTTLSKSPYLKSSSEIALQTTLNGTSAYAPGIVNGFIPYIQKLDAAPHSTLYVVTYLTSAGGGPPQYIVVAVEQIIDLIYSSLAISNSGFGSTNLNNSLTFFSIDLPKRAEDIRSIVRTLLTQKPYSTASSTVAIQTTLTGSFYPPFSNGLIPKVLDVSLTSAANETMLLITFQSSSYVNGTIVVGVDQVAQIIYFPN